MDHKKRRGAYEMEKEEDEIFYADHKTDNMITF